MKYPDEIVNYAKGLYFEIDDYGNKKWNYEEIANKLKERYGHLYEGRGYNISGGTISGWANKKDPILGVTWREILERALVKDIRQAKDNAPKIVKTAVHDLQALMETIELAEKVPDAIKFRWQAALVGTVKGYEYLLQHEIETPKEAQWLVEHGTKELTRLAHILELDIDGEANPQYEEIVELARFVRRKREEDPNHKPETIGELREEPTVRPNPLAVKPTNQKNPEDSNRKTQPYDVDAEYKVKK